MAAIMVNEAEAERNMQCTIRKEVPRVVRPAIDIVLYKDVIIISEVAHRIEIRDSIVASIPACHAGDRGSIPRHGEYFCIQLY